MGPKKTPKVVLKRKISDSSRCGFLQRDTDEDSDVDDAVSVAQSSDTEVGSPVRRTNPLFVSDAGAVADAFGPVASTSSAQNASRDLFNDSDEDDDDASSTTGTVIVDPNTMPQRSSTRRDMMRRLQSRQGQTEEQAPRTQKALWEYFEKIKTYFPGGQKMDRKKTKGSCKICKAVLKTPDSATNPLTGHLRSHHPKEYNVYLEARKEEYQVNAEAKKVMVKQGPFKIPDNPYFKQSLYKSDGPKQLNFDLDLAKLLVMCNLPFSLVESFWFKDFIAKLDARLTVKSRTTMSNTKIRILWNNIMEAVDNILKADLPKVIYLTYIVIAVSNQKPCLYNHPLSIHIHNYSDHLNAGQVWYSDGQFIVCMFLGVPGSFHSSIYWTESVLSFKS